MNEYKNIEEKLLIKIDDICSSKEPFDVLYYFALIERLLVELLDLQAINVEQSSQGIIKTANPLLCECEKNNILDPDIIKRLRYYYADDGIRNSIFHNRHENISILVSEIDELKQIINYLANLYEEKSEYIDNYPGGLIERV